MNVIDRIVVDKNPPDDRYVIWIDMSNDDEYVPKVWIKGDWRPMSSAVYYIGAKTWAEIENKPWLELASDLAVYYNGNNVTNDPAYQEQVVNAPVQWHGSASKYAQLLRTGRVRSDVAYHLMPNPDWDEDDETSLSYIKNKPKILDADVETILYNNKKLRLFYQQ